jgi:fluoroquinolone resistance protein
LARTLNDGARYQDQLFRELGLAGRRLLDSEFYDCHFEACAFAESVFQNCRFVGCTFEGCDLSLAQLPGSAFSATRFLDSRVIGVDWTQADWSGVSLGQPIGFERCALSHSTFIGLSLPGIQIKDCLAADVDFREADLSRADFSGSELEQSLFANTNLSKADLRTTRNYHIAPEKNVLKGARFALPEAMSLLYNLDIDLSEGE